MNRTIKFLLIFFLSSWIINPGIYSQGQSNLTNLGAIINSEGDEFSPSFTNDGKTMVFSMKKKNSRNSRIYISSHVDGKWAEPELINILNSSRDDENPFISFDGSMIVFSSNRDGGNFPADYKGDRDNLPHDIYMSYKIGNDWSTPEKVSENVNTVNNEKAPSISADYNTLYFTRWAGNDSGKAVIMAAQLTEAGFTNARELDNKINDGHGSFGFIPSRFREGFYFSSKRPGGSGSWDLYYIEHKQGKFSTPLNLGKEINSTSDELFANEYDQNTLYLSSNRENGIGSFDMYSYTVSPDFFANVSSVDTQIKRGETKDLSRNEGKTDRSGDNKDTGFNFKFSRDILGKPVSVKLRAILKYSGEKALSLEKVITGESNKEGNFLLITESGITSVAIETLSSGFKTFKNEYSVDPGKVKDVNIVLNGNVIADNSNFDPTDFKPIYFDYNSSEIRLEYIPYIYNIINYLRANRNIRLKIIGHSGNTPKCDVSEKIGLKRAKTVRDYIISFGIERNRVIVKSMGKKYPADEKFNQLNRRVEFVPVK